MSRLKLDIFSQDGASKDNGKTSERRQVVRRNTVADDSTEVRGANADERSRGEGLSPRFVPVRFYERHLRALDDAVHALRRRGHWKASKSEIIWHLIETHETELERFGGPDS